MLRACYRHAANALTVHPRVQMLILTSALLQTGTTCEKISGTNPEMEQPMQEERLAILEHPVVSGISDVLLSRGQRPGFRVSLRCQTAQQNGHGVCDCGGLRQGLPVYVSKTRATLLACLQDLHNQVLRQHGPNCIAACKALAAQRMSQDDSSAGAPDAFRLMMDLNKAKKTLDKAVAELKTMKERADKVNKQALELQKLVEGAEKEVILLQALLQAYSTGVKESMLLIVSLPCFCNSLSVFYFKMMSNLVIFGKKINKK